MGARRWSPLLFAILALATVPPAHAGNATVLPFLGFGDMALDSTTEHVFISSGVGGSSVAVLDFDGNLVKTITGQQGASGLAVDETSGTLYVALSNVSQISMIDTTTLNERSRVASTGMSSPRSLVLAGGRLWIGYGCATGGAGSVALDGSDPHTYYTWSGCARFARYPGDPNRFAVIEQSGSWVYIYDVSTGTPTKVTQSFSPGDSGNIQQIAVSPSGADLFIAAGAPYQIQRFTTDDFTLTNVYPTGPYPVAVAVTGDGAYVAGGTANGYSPDIFVFDTTTASEVRRWNFENEDLISRALAFNSDATRLFALTVNSAGTALVLHTFGSPTRVPDPTTLGLSLSATTINYGQTVRLTAHLAGVDSGTISFFQTPAGSTKTKISSIAVDASGNASLLYKPTKNTILVAEFAGDDTHAPATSLNRLVKVHVLAKIALRRYYGLSGKYKLYHSGTRPLVIGTVAPKHVSEFLTFVAQRYRFGSWRTTVKATFLITTDGHAYAVLVASPGFAYRVRSVFRGDSDHLGDASPWAYLRINR